MVYPVQCNEAKGQVCRLEDAFGKTQSPRVVSLEASQCTTGPYSPAAVQSTHEYLAVHQIK